ncbi:MAG: flagellar hook-basal body complex protein FliE [Oscillospiraceae bacterium]|nr:flagellar hook-basal body complex protein FliE [Oscillospiraceae bacterium]
MTVNPLSSSLINLLDSDVARSVLSGADEPAAASFADILTESFMTASRTDTEDKASAIELLTGQADDMSGLLLDAAKAEISLNLALQIRNKVIEAYNDIMRMQV